MYHKTSNKSRVSDKRRPPIFTKFELGQPIRSGLLMFYCRYTLGQLTLIVDHLSLNVCNSLSAISVPNFSEIEQSAVELQRFIYVYIGCGFSRFLRLRGPIMHQRIKF